MSRKTFAVSVILVLVFLAACSTPTPQPATPVPTTQSSAPAATATTSAPASPATITVVLLHTNDMHGALEGDKLKGGDGSTFEAGGIVNALGTIALIKNQVGASNTLTLDGGDLWQGTFPSNRDEGKSIIASMNAVGYDAMTLGNHDFDHDQSVMKQRAAEAQFPILAANIVEEATGKPPSWVKPYIIKQVNGVRFGIIGLANSGTPVISKPTNSKGLKFIDETTALKQIMPQVQSQSDLVIALVHQGLDRDESMASQVPGIAVIVSAHTHVALMAPRLVDGTLIVHSGYKAQNVGRLELRIDPATKKIVAYSRTNVIVPAVSTKATPPKQVTDAIGKIVAEAKDAISRPIGETQIDLMRAFTSDGRTTGEYPLGNLVVDAMLAASPGADLATYNQGVRADLPKGPITFGKLYEVLPFDNTVTLMDLKGEDLKAVMEIAASCPRVNELIAGMSFEYDCNKPNRQRVSNIRIKGQPFDPQKVYRVATIDYLATGGDGQAPYTKGTNLVYGDPVIDVVAAYVTKNSPLNPKVDGRIVNVTK